MCHVLRPNPKPNRRIASQHRYASWAQFVEQRRNADDATKFDVDLSPLAPDAQRSSQSALARRTMREQKSNDAARDDNGTEIDLFAGDE